MDNSPLGKLPPELRNEIYKLVLQQEPSTLRLELYTDSNKVPRVRREAQEYEEEEEGKEYKDEDEDEEEREDKEEEAEGEEEQDTKTNILALTTTCKVIREECKELFYTLNSFTLGCETSFFRLSILRTFQDEIGERHPAALRNVRFDNGANNFPAALRIPNHGSPTWSPRFRETICQVRCFALANTGWEIKVVGSFAYSWRGKNGERICWNYEIDVRDFVASCERAIGFVREVKESVWWPARDLEVEEIVGEIEWVMRNHGTAWE